MNAKNKIAPESKLHLGTWLSIGSPVVAELAGECGFDWALLDLEHGCGSESELPEQLRALKGSPTLGVVRLGPGLVDNVSRVLDWGATAIMAPHVDNAEQAEHLLKAMRYPPAGSRGVSRTVRAYRYGLDAFDPDSKPLFFAQIETLKGVQNARTIAEVPGVDVLFVGPADLQHDLAHTTEDNASTFDECIKSVARTALDAGKQAGILVRDAGLVPEYIALGYQWIAIQSDISILRDAFLGMTNNINTNK